MSGNRESNKGAPCLHREEFPCNIFLDGKCKEKMMAGSVVPESRSVRRSKGKAFVFPALHSCMSPLDLLPASQEQGPIELLLYGYLSPPMSNRVPQRQRSGRGQRKRSEMGRAFSYVILGGGVAAGYAALEFVRHRDGASPGELCIISDEAVAPYERPALSKGYLLPRGAARLPGFHTCVGANDDLLTEQWYKDNGIELVLATRVISADVRQKTLLTDTGEAISYKTLIVATGARALKLDEFGVTCSDAANVCYLRSLEDADRMVGVMRSCHGGNAVVIGGGYIGMECAAALVANEIKVTMVFPGKHCMDRLFTSKIAEFYENYYAAKGVTFIKEARVTSWEASDGKVAAAILRDGRRLPADMVVVGIGARANTGLFDGQLAMEKGGIKVNGRMQTSDAAVYAVGDVAAFPVALLGGDVRRFEHVDCARRTARRAVAAILEPADGAAEAGMKGFDYLPFFYSRVFGLSWQFYGDNVGEAVHFGNFSTPGAAGPATAKFVVLWVSGGRVSGAFIEGGSREENEATAAAVRRGASIAEVAAELESRGLAFADQESRRKGTCRNGPAASCDKPTYAWHATVGVAAAVSIAAFAYWYGWQAPYVVKREF